MDKPKVAGLGIAAVATGFCFHWGWSIATWTMKALGWP
jgi:hypothetical protein